MQISISNAIGGGGGAQGSGGGSSFASTNSFIFDGNNDYVDIGSPASLNLSTITISAWIKTTNDGSIVSSDDQSLGRRFIFQILISGELRFYYWNTSSAVKNIVSTTTLNDGNWHHVMAINNGTDLKLYINGTLDNSSLDGGNIKPYPSTPIHIGDRSYVTSRIPFNGSIDEVAIWSSDQSANASAIGSTIPTDLSTYNPISWWRMGEEANYTGREWVLTDQGSGGNNGFSDTLPAPPAQPSTDVPT